MPPICSPRRQPELQSRSPPCPRPWPQCPSLRSYFIATVPPWCLSHCIPAPSAQGRPPPLFLFVPAASFLTGPLSWSGTLRGGGKGSQVLAQRPPPPWEGASGGSEVPQACPLTEGHQHVGQNAEPRQHQGCCLHGAAAQTPQQQQGAHLGWHVKDTNEDLEQEDVAVQGLQVQGQAIEGEAKGKPGGGTGGIQLRRELFNCWMVLTPSLSSPCRLCIAEGDLCRLHFPGCFANATLY